MAVILSPSPCGVRSPFNTSPPVHPAANEDLEYQIHWPFLIHLSWFRWDFGSHTTDYIGEIASPPASSYSHAGSRSLLAPAHNAFLVHRHLQVHMSTVCGARDFFLLLLCFYIMLLLFMILLLLLHFVVVVVVVVQSHRLLTSHSWLSKIR